jgi:hypothetical protein
MRGSRAFGRTCLVCCISAPRQLSFIGRPEPLHHASIVVTCLRFHRATELGGVYPPYSLMSNQARTSQLSAAPFRLGVRRYPPWDAFRQHEKGRPQTNPPSRTLSAPAVARCFRTTVSCRSKFANIRWATLQSPNANSPNRGRPRPRRAIGCHSLPQSEGSVRAGALRSGATASTVSTHPAAPQLARCNRSRLIRLS